MSTFFALVKRELKSLAREKTIVLAIVIQLFIASFSSIIVIGLMSFYDPGSIGQNARLTVRVGIIGDTDGPLAGFLRERNLAVIPYAHVNTAEEAFRSGQIDTIIFEPKDRQEVVDMKLVLPDMDTKATVILMVLKEPLQKYENYLRERNGIAVRYADLQGKSPTTYEFLYSIIVPILMLFPALLAGSIVIDTVSEEIENKTLDTLRAAPLSLNKIFGAKIFTAVITVLVQCVTWLMLLRLNNLPVQNFGLVLLLCVIIGTFISVSAALIALYFKNREKSQFIYSIMLIITAGLSYFVNPSPFNLMARLATGDYYTGLHNVVFYLIPSILLGVVLFIWSEKLAAIESAK